MEALLTTDQAAEKLRVAPITMRKWRMAGTGPKYVRCGAHIRYTDDELAAWVAARTVTSTSEHTG